MVTECVDASLAALRRAAVLCGARWRVPRRAGARPRRRRPQAPATPAARRTWSCPTSGRSTFQGINGRTLLMGGLGRLRARPAVRPGDLHAAEEPAGARVDARDLRADLRDLQDLPDHAGQVHPDPRALHRRHHRVLLRRAAALRAVQGRRSSCSSAWSASPAATASPGSASASTPSRTRARRSPACAASRIRSTRFRSGPA